MTLPIAHSLRTRLLWFLLAAISIAAMAQAAIAYHTALSESDEIFDNHMRQMAMALGSGLPVAELDVASEGTDEVENFDFIVQVWTADGQPIFQSAARAGLPQRAVLGFSDVQAHGTTYRVYSVQSHSQVIQVAQDMASRREMAGTLALLIVVPIAVMAPLLMVVVWWVVTGSLAPVSRVRRQLAERQADDLTEVSEKGLPDEIRPLVRELNLLFARVRQAFDAQERFVADAAHELRSPLAALKLQAQGLQRASNNDARDVAVTRLTAGIDRATRLVEQLLLLARQQASLATGAKPQPVALAQIARLAIADAASFAQSRRIDLGLAQADDVQIMGHPEALRLLVRNLLDNAVKYTPTGGTADLEIRHRGDAVVLSVEDSGPGIPEEDRGRVLDRFHRIAGNETTGSGLGLAIVKSIADLHAARLSLDRSVRLGGLRVEVSFPASSG